MGGGRRSLDGSYQSASTSCRGCHYACVVAVSHYGCAGVDQTCYTSDLHALGAILGVGDFVFHHNVSVVYYCVGFVLGTIAQTLAVAGNAAYAYGKPVGAFGIIDDIDVVDYVGHCGVCCVTCHSGHCNGGSRVACGSDAVTFRTYG